MALFLSPKVVGKTQKKGKRTGEYDLHYHLDNKSNIVITLSEILRSKIKSLSEQIDERFNRMYIGYYIGKSFCQIRIQKKQLKFWINIGNLNLNV